ncbi:hypothetical protein LSTR_LSTR014876 [Laodelphax striatellus]|uniref:Ubiquitin-like protease family profile domain-containing protein n=1 Tax=Laodelphax striatellus TaxID=195883 RepID=A0A482WLF9_LAOST|nr:hypothetical protein LSTR_LSTR014876 [Laodelphax striatellus]
MQTATVIALPDRALTDADLYKYACRLKLKHFRGVFMRDALPAPGPLKRECGIINLDTSNGAGTHWVCYVKKDGAAIYFDGFGNLSHHRSFIDYMHRGLEPAQRIEYNYNQKQRICTLHICGHLCWKFLVDENNK